MAEVEGAKKILKMAGESEIPTKPDTDSGESNALNGIAKSGLDHS